MRLECTVSYCRTLIDHGCAHSAFVGDMPSRTEHCDKETPQSQSPFNLHGVTSLKCRCHYLHPLLYSLVLCRVCGGGCACIVWSLSRMS